MFVHLGGRTDIAHRYSDWFMNRVREGFVMVRNPVIPRTVHRYRLSPDVVDCFIVYTKDPQPLLRYVDEILERGFHLAVYVTITGYGPEVEPGVRAGSEVMETFSQLSRKLGRQAVFWRYDPVFVSERYTVEHHLACFDRMAAALAPCTDLCIFSFVELYAKLATSFPELNAVSPQERDELLRGFSASARAHGLRFRTCGDGRDYTAYGVERSACVTPEIIEGILGRPLKRLRPHPTREGCGCLPSNDIGAYDSCPNGCRYCYANRDARQARENFRTHDPSSPLLLGHVQPDDRIIEARQQSYVQPFEQLGLGI